MRRRAMPIGWPGRGLRHCRFSLPNAVWAHRLKPIELLILPVSAIAGPPVHLAWKQSQQAYTWQRPQ